VFSVGEEDNFLVLSVHMDLALFLGVVQLGRTVVQPFLGTFSKAENLGQFWVL
jgi:hypothetical protein